MLCKALAKGIGSKGVEIGDVKTLDRKGVPDKVQQRSLQSLRGVPGLSFSVAICLDCEFHHES